MVDGQLWAEDISPSECLQIDPIPAGPAATESGRVRLLPGSRVTVSGHRLVVEAASVEGAERGLPSTPVCETGQAPAARESTTGFERIRALVDPPDETERLTAHITREVAEATGSLLRAVGPGSGWQAVLADAARTAKETVSAPGFVAPTHYWPPVAVGTVLDGVEQELVGEGGTVRLRRRIAGSPTALIGLGRVVVMSSLLADGPASSSLQVEQISDVAAVRCRRLTGTSFGVEWCCQDPRAARLGRGLGMRRIVLMIPEGLPAGMDEVWQERVVAAMLGRDT